MPGQISELSLSWEVGGAALPISVRENVTDKLKGHLSLLSKLLE